MCKTEALRGWRYATLSTCECGSGMSAERCCVRYVEGNVAAPTAQALMRSRYFAFVHKNAAYLLESWHPSTRPTSLDFERDTTRWQKLEILESVAGDVKDTHGIVEFKAYFVDGGRRHCLHERSSFIREAGRWYYVDGVTPKPQLPPMVGRNQPCPCGSGKKFKRCCGA
ncbi:MAG: YchJ family metal-binding protein [Myxococcota bacterium]|nr:YchJ family metal-binding protein [Myxococcota bacterium]